MKFLRTILNLVGERSVEVGPVWILTVGEVLSVSLFGENKVPSYGIAFEVDPFQIHLSEQDGDITWSSKR